MRKMHGAVIEGRKKGGGGGSEAPNTLRSTQIADVVMLISEGEAQGLVNGLKSVYLDKVAVENPDGSRNFEDVSFYYLTGALGQPPLPGINAVQNEVAVGVQVNQGTPVVRTITNASNDKARVTITVPALTNLVPDSGDLVGYFFEWAIDLQSNGGGYVEKHNERIEGKTTQSYSRAVVLELTGSAPWDIRVRRLTPAPPANIQNNFVWTSYTEIQSIKLRYQNSAVAWLRVNAKSFGRIPTIAFDWLGQRVKIPSNYNPITRAYTGAWDGIFDEDWTSCPPWVLYDVVTNVRYGCGDWVSELVADKWGLYAIGQYCDALVPDGRGGQEPRFTCNVNIETRVEAFRLIRDLAAVFRGMVWWASNQVQFAQDSPSDPVHTFTPANVVDGYFNYPDVSEKTKHSVFICWWNDNSQFGKRVPEVYVDDALVARYGLKEIELAPLGCTSRGQAARACRWARHSEQLEAELVVFEVGSDGIAISPGQVFRVADPTQQGERLGGRIRSATTTQVTLDAAVTLASGETYSLTVLQPDPADPVKLVAETRFVTTPAGAAGVLTVGTAFSAAPTPESVWLLESNAVAATTWRCLNVEEVKGKNRFRVTGLAHNPSKYAAIELGLALDQRPVSRLSTVPQRPASVSVTESPYRVGSAYRSKVTISWPEPARGLRYRVAWRHAYSGWVVEPETSANSVTVDNLTSGNFECWVRSVNALGVESPARFADALLLLGKVAPPPDVSSLTQTLVQGGVKFEWLPCPDADYLTTEIRVGASWETGAVLFEGMANAFTWVWPALGSYTVWVKHFDTSLNESDLATSVAVNVTSAVYVQWGDVTGSGKPLDAKNWFFENGTADGWTNIDSVVAEPTASGGWCGNATISTAATRPTRPIPIIAGRTYKVTGRVRRNSGSGGTISVGARCFDSAGASIINTGGAPNPYCAAVDATLNADGVWRDFDGIISGVNAALPTATPNPNKFWPGTVQACGVLALSAGWTGDLQVDHLTIDDVTDALAAEAASFTAFRVWDFKRGVEGWFPFNATFVASAGGATFTSTASNPSLRTATVAVQGRMFDRIRAKVRRISGTNWEGTAYYLGTNVAAYDNNFRKTIPEPGANWQVLEWNMADLTVGGSDWVDSEITAMRLDLAAAAGNAFEIEWIAVGKLAPAGDVTDVSGAGWVGRGVMITGNNAVKVKPTAAYDSDVYSQEWFVGGCFAQASPGVAGTSLSFGINSDPTTDSASNSIDYCFNIGADGNIRINESGAGLGVFGTWVPGDVLTIAFDGFKVRYYKGGVQLREVAAGAATAFYFDSSFFTEGAKLNNMRFGPLSKVYGLQTEQLSENAATEVTTIEVALHNANLTAGGTVFTYTFAGASVANPLSTPVTVEVTVSSIRTVVTPGTFTGQLKFWTWLNVTTDGGSTLVGGFPPETTFLIENQLGGQTIKVTESANFSLVIPAGKTYAFVPFSRAECTNTSYSGTVIKTRGYVARLTKVKR